MPIRRATGADRHLAARRSGSHRAGPHRPRRRKRMPPEQRV